MSAGAHDAGDAGDTALTHIDASGRAVMVDVSDKMPTKRTATARAIVTAQPETLAKLRAATLAKGDALAVARIAGIMAAKRTAELIPLCHPLALDHVEIGLTVEDTRVVIVATATTTGRTGVEMEAMTAASVAALTLYDMAKASDRWMRVVEVALMAKAGGKSGTVTRPPERDGS
jgi:cyclic pyranopterin phosphate synthase